MQKYLGIPLAFLIVPILGIVIGMFSVLIPYLLPAISKDGILITKESWYPLAVLFVLLCMAAIPAGRWLLEKVKSIDPADPFIFFIPLFVITFLSGFHITISPHLLVLYVVFFIVFSLRGKITEIVATPFLSLVIVHLVFCNISLLNPSMSGPFPVYARLLQINIKLLLVFLVLNSLRSNQDLNRFFWLYIALSVFTCVVALGQVILFFLTGVNHSFSAPFISKVFSTPLGTFPRVTAFFSHPNLMGTDVSPLFMILLYFLITPAALVGKYRIFAFAVACFMLIPLFFSCSRGTWVAIACGMVLIFFMKRPELILHKILLLGLALVIFWLTGVIEFAYNALVSINEQSVSARYGLIALGFLAMKSNPVIGYGWDNFSSYSGNVWGLSVHNFPLQVFTETGVLGLITYFLMIGYIFWRVISQITRTGSGMNRAMLDAYLIALVTLAINNLFHQVAWSNFTFILLAMGEATVRIVKSLEERKREVIFLMPERIHQSNLSARS
jgi:O-antigen ligase